MAKRSEDWDKFLMADLRADKEFAKDFVIGVIKEGISPQLALNKIVKAYGVNEYAKWVNMAPSNVSRAINLRHNPTLETLNRLLEPLKLQLTIAPIPEKAKKQPARKKEKSARSQTHDYHVHG